jgi:hypothetical protein
MRSRMRVTTSVRQKDVNERFTLALDDRNRVQIIRFETFKKSELQILAKNNNVENAMQEG